LVFKSRRPTTPHAGLAAWYRFWQILMLDRQRS
jgi:hypothetical protein